MPLCKEKFKALYDALLDGFPSEEELTRMIRFGLGERLKNIVLGDNIPDIVFELIDWAESKGRVEELVQAAREENPGNPLLKLLRLDDAPESVGKAARIVSLPSRRNLYILEDAEMLTRMDTALQKYPFVVLHGVGGVGK